MGGSMARQHNRSGSPGCEIELEQASKGSTVSDYFNIARLRPRDAEFNWRRRGFGAKPPTGWAQFKEFTQRKWRSQKMKSL
jgi:hypothetical protein